MRLKTYRAPDLSSALLRARRELGPQALVLATSEIKGGLGLSSVEITVGIDETSASAPHSKLVRLAADVASSGSPVSRKAAQETRPARRAERPATHPALAAAVESLVRSGLDADLAERFARAAGDILPRQADPSRLIAATEKAMEELVRFAPTPSNPRVLFVVGPPGAGKTTAVARLAARAARRDRRDVVFAEADRHRVGSHEQAAAYSRLIGVSLASVGGASELNRVLRDAGPRGCVFVDTCGVASGDATRLRELTELRDAAGDADLAVLVPAGLHRDEARRVVRRFRDLRPTCVAFSKVDDGGRLGELVSAVETTGLPLAFVTNGHRVGDIEPASPAGLAALLLRAGFDEQPTVEVGQ